MNLVVKKDVAGLRRVNTTIRVTLGPIYSIDQTQVTGLYCGVDPDLKDPHFSESEILFQIQNFYYGYGPRSSSFKKKS